MKSYENCRRDTNREKYTKEDYLKAQQVAVYICSFVKNKFYFVIFMMRVDKQKKSLRD